MYKNEPSIYVCEWVQSFVVFFGRDDVIKVVFDDSISCYVPVSADVCLSFSRPGCVLNDELHQSYIRKISLGSAEALLFIGLSII